LLNLYIITKFCKTRCLQSKSTIQQTTISIKYKATNNANSINNFELKIEYQAIKYKVVLQYNKKNSIKNATIYTTISISSAKILY